VLVGELGGFLRCPELACKFDVLRRFRELPVHVIPDAMLHLLFECPKHAVRLAFPKSRWGDFTEPRREGIITDFSFLLLKREAVYTRLAGVRRLN
jgi:hypothetical protein